MLASLPNFVCLSSEVLPEVREYERGMATWLKPDSYYEQAWRRQPGAGPVLINLIHDIDLLRFLIGEVDSVQAITSNAVRGFEVEDTAAVIMRFACGALATLWRTSWARWAPARWRTAQSIVRCTGGDSISRPASARRVPIGRLKPTRPG